MSNKPVYHRNPEGNGQVIGCMLAVIFLSLFSSWPLFLHVPVPEKIIIEVIWIIVVVVFILLANGYNRNPGDRHDQDKRNAGL